MASWRHAKLYHLYSDLHNIPSPQKDLKRQKILHLCPILYAVVLHGRASRGLIFKTIICVA